MGVDLPGFTARKAWTKAQLHRESDGWIGWPSSLAHAILPHGAMPPATTYIWRLGHGSRFFKLSPTPGPNLNLLRFRVRLNEYYNFGRIERGRHGCFFGLENGHLRPPSIIFSRCAALVKAAPYGARGNLH